MRAPLRIRVQPRQIARRVKRELQLDPSWQFVQAVGRLIWEYKGYSLAILVVTILQELAALWPVSLLGQFVDRLQTGEVGSIVWLFMGASVLYPAILRGNVVLRHRMFYETDLEKGVEMTLEVADKGAGGDVESAGAAHTRVINAVSGIINAAYHVLGSFTPVIIKITVVSGSLLAYNRLLGLTYLVTLGVPALMTVLLNNKLRVLRDAQYSVISAASGAGVKTISEKDNLAARERFVEVMGERKGILVALVSKSQAFLYAREAILVGGQFLVVFLALSIRHKIGLTPGDFTKIVGYTAQVAAAFIGAASVFDAIVSYTRAYHVYVQAHGG